MPRTLLIVSQSDSLIQIVDINFNSEWQTVHIQISWLSGFACLQRQGISGFSMTRVNDNRICLILLLVLQTRDPVYCSKNQGRIQSGWWCWWCVGEGWGGRGRCAQSNPLWIIISFWWIFFINLECRIYPKYSHPFSPLPYTSLQQIQLLSMFKGKITIKHHNFAVCISLFSSQVNDENNCVRLKKL